MTEEHTSRRTVIQGLVIGGAAVPFLAACGAASTTSAAKAGTVLAKTSDIPVGGGKIFAEQSVVVTQPTAGVFKAFSAICTHASCTVSSVSGGDIRCACHGSEYAIATGKVVGGPAPRPLPAVKINVKGGSISIA
ncbi:MAG: iron-sulfur protein [Marmoricola sp.]|nr:iron-sulfur protein [Marmoricola sp.]